MATGSSPSATAESQTLEEIQLIVFCLANEEYAVDIGAVREIVRLQPITKVPRAAAYVEGLTNLRGRVVPVVDLRRRFDLPTVEDVTNNRIVIVDIDGEDIGVIVDSVTEVLRVPSDCLEPPSSIVASVDSKYLTGIAKLPSRLIILLELARVFAESRTDAPEEGAVEY
jgi:purine-binding chemotaxis protein CheW